MKATIKQTVLRTLPDWMAFGLSTAYSLTRQRLLQAQASSDDESGPSARQAAELAIAIREAGFVVLPNYKSADWCSAMRSELLSAMGDGSRTTLHTEDTRLFGIENLSQRAASFASDPMLLSVASLYAKSRERLLFCMANRVSFREGVAFGSGGEWHRDSFRKEVKAMLYLSDVGAQDGPFCVLEGSHRGNRLARDVRSLAVAIKRGQVTGLTPTRLGDAGIRLAANEPERLLMLTANAGTLILFDGSLIHTGAPPQPGGKERWALTNYYCSVRSYQ
ncbi:MAG: phytanoyl-CoA dioxygenase family protein, partial [Rhizobacter sp.]|nr:phytanoyl-CoA dioxygenase family protein [Rhizobacter sp.]